MAIGGRRLSAWKFFFRLSETVTQQRGLFDAVGQTSFLLRTRTRVFRKNRPLDHKVCVKLCGTMV